MSKELEQLRSEVEQLRAQQAQYIHKSAMQQGELEVLRPKAARWDAIETLMIAGDVELTQAEDGGYSVFVEPVENILPQSWDGGTPDQVVDKVVAQLAVMPAR